MRPSFAAALCTLLVGFNASALEHGFQLDRHVTAPAGSRWMAAESLSFANLSSGATIGETLVLRLDVDWARNPLVVTPALAVVVNNQVTAQLGASFSPWENLRVQINVPLQLYANGSSAAVPPYVFNGPSQAAAFGDVRLGATWRFYGAARDMVRGGITGTLILPTGVPGAYAADDQPGGQLAATAAGDVAWFGWSASFGAEWKGLANASYDGASVGPKAFGNVAVGIRNAEHDVMVGLELPMEWPLHDAPGNVGYMYAEPTLGAHWRFTDSWRVHPALSTGLSRPFGGPVVRAIVAMEWVPMAPPPPPEEVPVNP